MGNKLRLRFSKTGKAKYISHLDLMATMRRTLLRAGIGLAYSEGFNPHPYISIALPLPVGTGSICELMDIGLAVDLLPDGLPEIINEFLPEGLKVLEVYSPEAKLSSVAWIDISGLLYYDAGAPRNAAEKLTERFAENHIVISKKTKRGISDIDISPFIRDVCFTHHSEVIMSARISAQNPTITPENLMSSLIDDHKALIPDFYDFTRTQVLDKDMNVFR